MSPAEIAFEEARRRSPWIQKLDELLCLVEDGGADTDTFYRLGEFGNSDGATTIIRQLRGREDVAGFIAMFDFKALKVNEVSELWASVKGDPVDGHADQGDADLTADLTSADA